MSEIEEDGISFAMEYSGALTDIPSVSPFGFRGIPFASFDDSLSDSNDARLPVVHPLLQHEDYSSDECGDIPLAEEYISRELPREEAHPTLEAKQAVEVSKRGEEASSSSYVDDYMIPGNVNSVESTPSTHSSEAFSSRDEAVINTRRTHVTFEEPSPSPGPSRRTPVRTGKKGTCYHCSRGSKLTTKEECLVCGAKYCSKCVIRAMGSMPEGRKCTLCIGFRIDENKRTQLGKPSKLLHQILPEIERKAVMNRELISEPEIIFVNNKALSQQEVLLLLNSRYPPKNLKPGEYWYDKSSGMWGKMGKKPSQIITPSIKIGGNLNREASNGSSDVLLNGREVTKPELRMLQMAGVNCDRGTSLWVSPDGSYQQEGMGNVQGKIWDSSKAKLACICFSLPIPPSPSFGYDDVEESSIQGDKKSLYKLLMVGCVNSGTSTIFKQARFVYNASFSAEEREECKQEIRSNLYRYLAILLEAGERFEEETLYEKRQREDEIVEEEDNTVYTINPSLKIFSKLLQDSLAEGKLETIFPASNREYSPLVERLWQDPAFPNIFNRRQEIKSLPPSAPHFLHKSIEIARTGYNPSDDDILLAEGATTFTKEASTVEFTFPQGNQVGVYEYSPNSKYQLVRVHSKILEGNGRRLEMFAEVDVVIFCVSLTDYADSTDDSQNKMMKNRETFERLVKHPSLANKRFLLALSKFDLLEARMNVVPLSHCEWFSEFNPLNTNTSMRRQHRAGADDHAFMFIAIKFMRLYTELTGEKLYVSLVKGLEKLKVDEMMRYARDIIKWDEEKASYNNNEVSSASFEECTLA